MKVMVVKKNTVTSTYSLYLAGTIQRYNKVPLHNATEKNGGENTNHSDIAQNCILQFPEQTLFGGDFIISGRELFQVFLRYFTPKGVILFC